MLNSVNLKTVKFSPLIIIIDYVTCLIKPWVQCFGGYVAHISRSKSFVWLCFPGPRDNDKVILIHKPTTLQSQSVLLNHEALIIQSPDCNQTKTLSHPSVWKLITDPTLGNGNKLIWERTSRLSLGKLRFLHCLAITQHGFLQTSITTCSYGNTIPALMGATH